LQTRFDGESSITYNGVVGLRDLAGRKGKEMNGYVAFYKNQRKEVYAETAYAAQQEAARQFRARKAYEVHVVLAEKNGEQVVHVADF
jgi:hypothetical protein